MPRATPPAPHNDPRFARDVAKLIDRRRMRRKLTLWTLLLAIVAAAAGYLRCGHGFGLGGDGGKGDGRGPGSVQTLVPRRCALRISATGITVDGKPMPRDEAVATCRDAGGAEVTQTGDAPEGKLTALRAALQAAKVPFVVRDPSAGGAPGSAAPRAPH